MGTNPATKHTDEFRRETADYIISSGRPITECCRELGLSSKTVNRWAIKRRRELAGDTVNVFFADCANEPAPTAPTHFRRFRQRTFAVFGYSASLLSRGRSFSR